jgi:hypothetical protein
MKIDGMRVKELEWKVDSSDVCTAECLFGEFEIYPNLAWGVMFRDKAEYPFDMGMRETLAEAKAFCQKHLEGLVLGLLEEVDK